MASIENFAKRFSELYSEELINDAMYYREISMRTLVFEEFKILENLENYFYLTKNALAEDIEERKIKANKYIKSLGFRTEVNYKKVDYFSLEPISLMQLIGINPELSILSFISDEYKEDPAVKFQASRLKKRKDDYCKILEAIRSYFVNSKEEYEDFRKSDIGFSYLYDYYEYVEFKVINVLSNLNDTILYLKKANVFLEFKDILLDYFNKYEPTITIKKTYFKSHTVMNTYPNKIVSYVFNLNESISKITNDIKKLKNDFLKTKFFDIDLLDEKNQPIVTYEPNVSSNRVPIYDLKAKLFIFDAKVLGFANDYINENLVIACGYDIKYFDQNIKNSTIKKYYNEVSDLVKQHNKIKKIVGRDIWEDSSPFQY